MLADPDEIHSDLIGKNRLLDKVADDLRGVERFSIRSVGNVTEGIQTEFHVLVHAGLLASLADERAPPDLDARSELRHSIGEVDVGHPAEFASQARGIRRDMPDVAKPVMAGYDRFGSMQCGG